MTACPECTAVLDDGANFCHVCGADVRAAARPSGADRGSAPPPDEASTTVMPSASRAAQASSAADATGDEDPTDPGNPPPVTSDPTEVVPAVGTVSCPNCGANNSSRRTLCGRCGADLATGEVAPRPAQRPIAPATPSEPRASERDRDTRGRTIALIVAAGIMIGGLIGAAVALGLGPLGDDDAELPAVLFDPAVYDEEATSLRLTAVATRTVHPASEGSSFDRERMFDGDLTTAWLNSGDTIPQGEGEVIRVELAQPAWVTEIVVANGDQADSVAFANNARLHRVTARVDGDVIVGLVFLDTEGQQAVRFPQPVLTTAVRLEVDETFHGATFDDLAVSELSFRGHLAVGTDVERAQERAQLAPTPG